MEAKQLFEDAFDDYPRWYRILVKNLWFLFPEDYKRIQLRMLNGEWPDP
jgi:hypothetical protein